MNTRKIALVSKSDYFVTNIFDSKEDAADELMYDIEEIIDFLNSDTASEFGFLRYIISSEKAKKKKPEYIIQIDPKNGNAVNVFDSIKAACESVNSKSIVNAISSNGKKAKGYLWKDNRNVMWHILQQIKPTYIQDARILYYKVVDFNAEPITTLCYSLNEVSKLTGLFWGDILQSIMTKCRKKGFLISIGGLTDNFTEAAKRYNAFELSPVVQLTYTRKQQLIIYSCAREAEFLNNIQYIGACLKNNTKSSGGYVWRKYSIGKKHPIEYKSSDLGIFADAVKKHRLQERLNKKYGNE